MNVQNKFTTHIFVSLLSLLQALDNQLGIYEVRCKYSSLLFWKNFYESSQLTTISKNHEEDRDSHRLNESSTVNILPGLWK